MNNVDKQYLDLLRDILENGYEKETRAGKVKSLFGKSMEFNLKEGLPLLTTKKVFYKGIIHELIWFLKGETNIKYLVDNNVHIWDDDAYRWYKLKIAEILERNPGDLYTDSLDKAVKLEADREALKNLSKEDFIKCVQFGDMICDGCRDNARVLYTFGDLGPIYGKQWRNFGISGRDQIQDIIEKLKNNPDDRRMLCVAFNPDVLDEVALPPCHVMFQFYTRELTYEERMEHKFGDYSKALMGAVSKAYLDSKDVPKRELSMMWIQRSCDLPCGIPFNSASFAMLQYIMCNICNMVPGKLVFFGGDVHIYENQIESCKEQLTRKGYDTLPRFVIKRKLNNIDDIKFDDFEVVDYKSDPAIKFPLSVG